MDQFAESLHRLEEVFDSASPVVDETHLQGRYDFSIHFTPLEAFNRLSKADASNNPASDPNGAISVFDALRSQLGLKLQSRTMPGSVLIIDAVNLSPDEN